MNQIELVRTRIVRAFSSELIRLRQFLSMTDNREALPKLDGKEGEKLLVDLTDATLKHIGVNVAPFAKDGRTQSSKAVKR